AATSIRSPRTNRAICGSRTAMQVCCAFRPISKCRRSLGRTLARPQTGGGGAPVPGTGAPWLAPSPGGIVHLVDGTVRASYSSADGLAKGEVGDVRIATDGAIWVATVGGLSRIKAGRIATLAGNNGLPCDEVIASVEDSEAMWIDTGCG